MKFLKFVVLPLFIFGIASVIALGVYVYRLNLELPTVEEMAEFKYTEPMVVYDSEGVVIAELGTERRYPVPLDRMPKYMQQAVVAVEDARFYEHGGVDLLGIMRAFITNVKAGRVVEGGSTLTQQLVKILYLTPEKKLKRKVKEAILAYKIDERLSKDNILELYLNQVNFGRGAYGVQAAAVNYFGKNVDELTLAEAALIAGIPKAPSSYAPHISKRKATARRNHVLYRMYELGYISEEEYKAAVEEEIIITDTIPSKLRYAGYFMDYVHKYLAEDLGISNAQGKGIKVYTTLKLDFQLSAEKAVRDNLISISKREGFLGALGKYSEKNDNLSLIEIEEESVVGVKVPVQDLDIVPQYLATLGYKKALVVDVGLDAVAITVGADNGTLRLIDSTWAKPIGSEEPKLLDFKTILEKNDVIYVTPHNSIAGVYILEQEPSLEGALISINPQTGEIYAMVGGFSYEKSFFNRVSQAKRQTGSLFKPIVYAAAYESGMLPMDQILDVPVINQTEDEKTWKPKNFEDKFYGLTTLKEALVKSRNVVTIKVAEKIGIRKVIRYAKDFGISTEMPDNDLSVSLGSASASPLEMAYVYSTFANEGKRVVSPYFITKIEDIDGNIIHEFPKPEHIVVLDPVTNALMVDNLVGVVEKGSGWRAKVINREIGGKTGTTNESKDTWFATVLPSLVTVSWVGYDDFRNLGAFATGSSAAAPALVDYMLSIQDKLPFELFPLNDKTAYFRVDSDKKAITDSLGGAYTFELFPIDEQGNPVKFIRQRPVQTDPPKQVK